MWITEILTNQNFLGSTTSTVSYVECGKIVNMNEISFEHEA